MEETTFDLNLIYCAWCGEGDDFERMNTIIYIDNCVKPGNVSHAHICSDCQEAYENFVEERGENA